MRIGIPSAYSKNSFTWIEECEMCHALVRPEIMLKHMQWHDEIWGKVNA